MYSELPTDYYIPVSDIHQFEFTIEDGDETLKIAAIFVGDVNAIQTDTVILYCQGNRDHMDDYWPRQKLLSDVGHQGRFGGLMFDYPGYGLSEGKPTEENMYAATDGALNWLKEKGLEDDRDRKSTRLNSSHVRISYAVFCLKKKIKQ